MLTFSSSFFFASFCFFFACAKFIKYVYTATSKPSVINAPAFVWKKEIVYLAGMILISLPAQDRHPEPINSRKNATIIIAPAKPHE